MYLSKKAIIESGLKALDEVASSSRPIRQLREMLRDRRRSFCRHQRQCHLRIRRRHGTSPQRTKRFMARFRDDQVQASFQDLIDTWDEPDGAPAPTPVE